MMAGRASQSYRGARRNACRRDGGIWARGFYYFDAIMAAMKRHEVQAGEAKGKNFGAAAGLKNFFFPGSTQRSPAPSARAVKSAAIRARRGNRGG